MLDAARRGGYAYPAINVTSSQTLNAALQGFADAESDGIIQVSVGGAAYFSGQGVNDRVTGSLAFAAFAHEVAKRYPHITVALHTDHCAKQYLDGWVRPLLDMEADEVAHGREPMFQSHMWTVRRFRWTKTSPSPNSCSTSPSPRARSWKSKSARSAAKRTVIAPKSTKNCIPRRPMA